MKYAVVEDNGGGITLVVFNKNNDVIYVSTGFQFFPGELKNCIKELERGADPSYEWENNFMYDVNAPVRSKDLDAWFPYESQGIGWEIIADSNGVYEDKMGTAGYIAFGIERGIA